MQVIHYPKWVDECGEYIGALRQMSTYHMTINIKKYDRGDQNNSRNQKGLKGELIYALYLERKGSRYKMPRLWGNEPMTQYDFQVDGYNIDVKTTDGNTLHVNKTEHENKSKGIHIYAFIVLTGKFTEEGDMIAHLYHCTHDEVTSWGVTQSKFTLVYQVNLQK